LNTLRNSVALFLQYVNSSLKTLVIVVVELVILYFTRYAFFVGFVILPVVIFYTVSLTVKDIFVKLENPKPVEEDVIENKTAESAESGNI
jgi:MFS superfamily sulfate permease-like transporter